MPPKAKASVAKKRPSRGKTRKSKATKTKTKATKRNTKAKKRKDKYRQKQRKERKKTEKAKRTARKATKKTKKSKNTKKKRAPKKVAPKPVAQKPKQEEQSEEEGEGNEETVKMRFIGLSVNQMQDLRKKVIELSKEAFLEQIKTYTEHRRDEAKFQAAYMGTPENRTKLFFDSEKPTDSSAGPFQSNRFGAIFLLPGQQ
ncbi:unnamed protein product [Caenorhabditis sp. 36 PRJEB53466]|nr:unnamed protein product [Caenorhabditis sp. 36 PRJEB53466]